MIINPKTVIEKGWITNVDLEKSIQPNSIDVRLRRLFVVNPGLVLGIETKTMPEQVELFPDEQGYFSLSALVPYQFLACEAVYLPNKVTMRLHMRSTLNRSGIFIAAGHWDSGFSNTVGASIYAFRDCRIERGARIAQAIFTEAEESDSVYAGQYNIPPDWPRG